jgi:hypothetical protein
MNFSKCLSSIGGMEAAVREEVISDGVTVTAKTLAYFAPQLSMQAQPANSFYAAAGLENHATFSARAISLARKISSAVTFAIGMSGAQYRSGIPLLCHL